MTDTTPFRTRQMVLSALIALGGHVIVIAAALLTAAVARPTSSNEFRDLAAAVSVLLGGEILLGVAALVSGAVLFRRDQRERGLGLVLGWIVGLLAIVAYAKLSS